MSINANDEQVIDQLADLCCSSLKDGEEPISDVAHDLVKTLASTGFKDRAEKPLGTFVTTRAKEKCPDIAIHRTSELNGLVQELQQELDVQKVK